MTPRTCADAQSLRSHLRDVSMDRHEVTCPFPIVLRQPCPYDVWKREGDEEYYDETHGPIEPCACCASCRSSCRGDIP